MSLRILRDQRGWSLPITPIVALLIVSAFLVWRFGWWWLGLPLGVWLAVAIGSVIVRWRADARRAKRYRQLGGPLYGLFHIREIQESWAGGYLYDIVPGFEERFPLEERRSMVEAMQAALDDPDIDFDAILPDLGFTDDEIREHLKATLSRLGKGEARTGAS